jgi:TIR domain
VTNVFVSYSRKDKAIAEKLTKALNNGDLETWIDWEDIPPTADWLDQIHKGIEQSDGFLFLLSNDSLASKVCGEEVDHAVQNGKRLIPIVVRDVNPNDMHPALAKVNWIYCRSEDEFNEAINKTLTAIRTDLVWVEAHRRLQVRALEWDKRTDASLFLRGKDLREAEEQLANAGQKDPQPTDLQRQFVLESRKAESRTRNTLLSASVTAIILLIGITIWAFIERDNAIRQAKISLARQLVAQGQLEYEEKPLLGISLVLEASIIAPADDLHTQNFILDSIKELSMGTGQPPGGRLLKLGDDVEQIYPNPDASVFIIDHASAVGELRYAVNGEIIGDVFSGKVSNIDFGPDPAATYFVVSYDDAPTELRRTSDGKIISTQGAVGFVSYSPDPAAAYFVVAYDDAPGELYYTSTGALLAKFTGKIDRVIFSPNASYFLVDYYDDAAPAELWRTADGAKVVVLTENIYNGETGVIFSPDPAATYFFVEYHLGAREPELRRAADGALLYQSTGLVTVTFSTDAAHFLVDYYYNVDFNNNFAPGELRRTIDGTLITKLTGSIDEVHFSPDAHATYFVVDYEPDTPSELRLTANGAIFSLTSEISSLQFSPDPSATYFVVGYDDNTPSELWRTADRHLIAQLTGGGYSVFFSPDPAASYFVLYGNENELRRSADGALINTLNSFSISNVVFSPDPDMTYFMLYTHGTLWELRRSHDGALISTEIRDVFFNPNLDSANFIVASSQSPGEQRRVKDFELVDTLSGTVEDVIFSPDSTATYFVVDYFDAQAELWRTSDNTKIANLTGPYDFTIQFSPDPSMTHFIVDYENAPGELYSTENGRLVGSLTGSVIEFHFSPDPAATYFVVDYEDGRSELWDGQGGARSLVELGLGKEGYFFEQKNHRLVVWYTDGRAYLLDIDWLKALGDMVSTLSNEGLMQLACEGPLDTGLFDTVDKAKLGEYLAGNEPRACG